MRNKQQASLLHTKDIRISMFQQQLRIIRFMRLKSFWNRLFMITGRLSVSRAMFQAAQLTIPQMLKTSTMPIAIFSTQAVRNLQFPKNFSLYMFMKTVHISQSLSITQTTCLTNLRMYLIITLALCRGYFFSLFVCLQKIKTICNQMVFFNTAY